MITPLDAIPSFHQALRNDMKIIDYAAYKAVQKAAICRLWWSGFAFSARF